MKTRKLVQKARKFGRSLTGRPETQKINQLATKSTDIHFMGGITTATAQQATNKKGTAISNIQNRKTSKCMNCNTCLLFPVCSGKLNSYETDLLT
uniref:Uncharacterized protein MANES_06G166800 n=1 Tax=Rhizophora mucronata TaxID=61149 RepID=A0A2P2LY76_RHIMU